MDGLIMVCVLLIGFLWAWALLDIAKSTFKNKLSLYLSLALILLFPALGPLLYFNFKKKFTHKRTFRLS